MLCYGCPDPLWKARIMAEYSKKLDAMNLGYNKRLKLYHKKLRTLG